MDSADTPLHDLQPTLGRLRAAWQAHKPDYAQRRDDLQRLRDALKRRLDEMDARDPRRFRPPLRCTRTASPTA